MEVREQIGRALYRASTGFNPPDREPVGDEQFTLERWIARGDELGRALEKHGLVIAPREPTAQMEADGVVAAIDLGLDGPDGIGPSDMVVIWAAMTAGAPKNN